VTKPDNPVSDTGICYTVILLYGEHQK